MKDWVFCATGFGRKKKFCCEEEPMQREVAVCLMSINGKMRRRIGFGTIIAKTRGICVIAIN